jgi:endonuclease/exonuclease/phosphatase family metal-dependent hydrolase
MAELRVMTWNVRGARRPDLDELAGRILAAHPDVVGIQEIRRHQASTLAARLRWHHHWALKHYGYGPLVWLAEGMAVLSPYPLPTHTRVVLNPSSRPWSHHRRIMELTRMEHPDGEMCIVNAHLASHQAPAERVRQAAAVADVVRRENHERLPTLIIGDLNAPDEPATLEPLVALGLRDAWCVSEDGPTRSASGFTNPSERPSQRIDYVLVPSEMSVDGVDVPTGGPEWASLSDHLPVVARLRVREQIPANGGQ